MENNIINEIQEKKYKCGNLFCQKLFSNDEQNLLGFQQKATVLESNKILFLLFCSYECMDFHKKYQQLLKEQK